MDADIDTSTRSPEATTEPDVSGELARRALLRGGLAAALGVFALEQAWPSTGPPASPVDGALTVLPTTSGSTTRARVVMDATDVAVRVVGATPSWPARHGDQLRIDGVLLVDGVEVGELHGTGIHLVRTGRSQQGLAAGTWQHVFQLDDGTIVGAGAATHDDEPDELAIVGGTGSYARATGTYTAQVAARGLGGDATASFIFDITIPED